ncbi:MAG: DUF3857 domain-containing protein [Cytophagaceae bacterium]|nr:MAG: DUF3857 domain-containing protein [Cytophagaceae bacterium]
MHFSTLARLTALFGLLGTLWPITLIAQTAAKEPDVKYGQVTDADFKLKPMPDDTTAEAVVLYESVDTKHEYRNEKLMRVSYFFSRIRINKKSGYDQATVEIPIRGTGGTTEYASAIEGTTYRLLNGQVTKQKMDKAAVISERITDNRSITKFTLPGVQEGCIIEYRYTVFSSNQQTPPSWRFQQSIPVVWSDYKMTISNYFHFKGILKGYLPLTISENKPVSMGLIPTQNYEGGTFFHYAIANAPAFRKEPYITTSADYVAAIDFELARVEIPGYVTENYSLSWGDMDRNLLARETFSGQYKKAPYLRDVAEKIKAKYPITDTLGRATAAYNYVRNLLT